MATRRIVCPICGCHDVVIEDNRTVGQHKALPISPDKDFKWCWANGRNYEGLVGRVEKAVAANEGRSLMTVPAAPAGG